MSMRSFSIPLFSRSTYFSVLLSTLLCAASLCGTSKPAAAQALPSPRTTAPHAFSSASISRPLSFPEDHGAHPDFQTEWWYFTGHLFLDGQTVFKDPSPLGFQLTFFRRASLNPDAAPQQTYLAHAALSDHATNRFSFDQYLSRSTVGIAGAATNRLSVWNRDWRAEMVGDAIVLEFSLDRSGSSSSTKAANSHTQVKLVAKATPPRLHGEGGYSAKTGAEDCADCASHYYSMPGMQVTGTILKEEVPTQVSGIVWMDHEFMSNALQPNQVGWDWFSLSHKDGRHFMLFNVRDSSGAVDFASASVIEGNTVKTLTREQFSIEVLRTWTSPQSAAKYPARWRVKVPSESLDVTLNPRASNQELHWNTEANFPHSESKDRTTSPKKLSYWEGAISDEDQQVLGYAELTGYAGAMGDVL